LNQLNVSALAIIKPSDYLHYLIFGGVAYLVSISVFSLLLYAGISSVDAHVSASAASSCVIFILSFHWLRKSHTQFTVSIAYISKILLFFIVSTAIQGGVFHSLVGLKQVNEYVAYLPAAFCGLFILITMVALYISPKLENVTKEVQIQTDALVLITATVAVRLVYLGLPELMEQEAYYWNYAQHPALSYLDHPPMVAGLIWLGTKLFGVSEFGVRIAAFICWSITAFFSYRLTKELFGKSAAIGAVLLLSVLPLYFGVGFLMTPDAPLHAAWSALLYFLYRALIDHRSKAWLGVGVSLGLGMLSKYTIVLLGPAILCFMLFDRKARSWFLKPEPYVAVILALILFLPVIIWNIQHDWVSFLFQSSMRVASKTNFTTHYLVGYLALILTPAGMWACLLFFVSGNKIFKSVNEKIQTDNNEIIDRKYLLLILLTLSPFLVFLVFSVTKEVKLNWTSPVWLAVIPFLGFTATSIYGRFCSFSLLIIQDLWRITIPILIITFAIAMHYVTLGLPGLPHASGPFLIGWDGLANEIELIVDEVEKDSGKRPIVVGMDHYQITSGLAFYRTKNNRKDNTVNNLRPIDETIGWHLLGFNSRMYQYWYDPHDWQGVEILAVASKKMRLTKDFLKTDIVFNSDIYELDAKKEDQPVRRLYYRLISGHAAECPNCELM
jgi:dolichol-phosphate mannosyltransferase